MERALGEFGCGEQGEHPHFETSIASRRVQDQLIARARAEMRASSRTQCRQLRVPHELSARHRK